MSNKKVHMIRSHRSKRSYKLINKTMRNAEAKVRKNFRRFVNLAARGKDALERLRLLP